MALPEKMNGFDVRKAGQPSNASFRQPERQRGVSAFAAIARRSPASADVVEVVFSR